MKKKGYLETSDLDRWGEEMKALYSKANLNSILMKTLIGIVVVSAFFALFARVPESSSYFTSRVVSELYEISND